MGTEAGRRWLVAGAQGMLGRDVVDLLRARGVDVTAHGRGTLDVGDPAACREAAAGHDVVVNCAAYTNVDGAESDEAAAFVVNADGPANLAAAAATTKARFVQISTDYVFDGVASTPYLEDSTPEPQSAYGRTKLAGERSARAAHDDVLVVRTAWLYGAHGRCFPRTIARLLTERDAIDVVDDQVGQPTWTADLAELVVRLIGADAPAGTYHGTSSGSTSWHGFATAVADAMGTASAVRPIGSDAIRRPAPRPAYSVLSHARLTSLGLAPIGAWRERFAAASATVLSDLDRES